MAGTKNKTVIDLWRRYQRMAKRRQEGVKRFARSVAGRYLATETEPRPLWPWLVAGVGTGVGLTLATTFGSRKAMRQRQASAPEVSRTTVVDGILMRWEEQGEGAPVVLVHGIPTNPRLWRFVLPRLTGVKALAWEMVGYGWSIPAGFGRDISLRAQSVYLYRWLQTMGIDRAIFVGHDLGGGVVQRFAVEHPEMCAGLVLVDSVAYDNWPVAPMKAARASRNAIAKMPNPLVRPLVTSAVATLGHDSVQGRAEAPHL
ncbi:MAG: alpha/beta fold hydrolase, partial [Myxococcales bacterium]